MLITMMLLQSTIAVADLHHVIYEDVESHSLLSSAVEQSITHDHSNVADHQCGHSHCVHFVALSHDHDINLPQFSDHFEFHYRKYPILGISVPMFRPPKA